jgi:hypothetical protein
MKNFIKDYWPGLLNVGVLLATLILMLAPMPGAMIVGSGGWLVVRGIVLIWSTVMAIGTYSNWINFGIAIKALIKGNKSNSWANSKVRTISLVSWIALWIVFGQIMASFYVAEWCIGGF